MLPEGLLEIIVIGGHSTDNSLEAAAVVSAEVASTSRDQREKEEPQATAESCDDLGFCLERTTGFEPATSTLARLRSTN